MNKEDFGQASEWNFPEVDTMTKADQFTEIFPSTSPEMNEVLDPNKPTEKMLEQKNQAEQELIQQKLELENIKGDYANKVDLLNNILNKMKNPISIIDEELIEILHDLIKKLTHKIISKEVEVDKNLLPNMINELKALIESSNGIISIFVSEADFTRLNQDKNQPSITGMNVDNNIGIGDIIVKSNISEVRAILNERIDQLLRIQYG